MLGSGPANSGQLVDYFALCAGLPTPHIARPPGLLLTPRGIARLLDHRIAKLFAGSKQQHSQVVIQTLV